MKTTAIAHSNIALIKYWGKKNNKLRIPSNNSISINLSNLYTTTTIEFDKKYKSDDILINNIRDEKQIKRASSHLDIIRSLAKTKLYAKVVSENNFPSSSGLASSASGFAALTLSAITNLNLKVEEKQITTLARLGSGSACRSIPDGIVEWVKGNSHNTSFAYSLFKANYLSISILAIVLQNTEKEVSSTDGMKNVQKNIFFKSRILNLNKKLKEIKHFIQIKDYDKIFSTAEQEALELHAIIMTTPPFNNIYWSPETIKIIRKVWNMRKNNIPVYFTNDAGSNIFLLCEDKYTDKVLEELKEEKGIKQIIVNKPSEGSKIQNKHLF